MLIDTHAHLYWDSYKDDLDEVIKRCIDSDVTTVINIGVDVKLSKIALRQAQARRGKLSGLKMYSTIAIHPQEAVKYINAESIHEDIGKLEQIYQSAPDQIVAVGETGLDYFFGNNKDLQRQLFKAQIELAKKLNLPLVVHVREAWDEVFELIGNHPTVLHCYSGLMETTKKAMDTPNIIISFAANITYPKNEYLREAVKFLPLEKILLETDSPFLAPQSKRGQRNEPCAIKEIAEAVAQIKGVVFEEVANQTTQNTKRIFAL